jgi:tetratricopeptide (TPR) repeat protein
MSLIKEKSKGGHLFFLLSLAAIICLVFSPVLKNQIVNWDDVNILDRQVNGTDHFPDLRGIFSRTVLSTYIPLTILSFAIEYHFFGNNPFVYHLDNVLLHILIVSLIYFFIHRLGFSRKVAFISALLFAVHPLHVEPVAWIAERKGGVYAFFYLLSMHTYLTFLQSRKKGSYALSLFWGLFSMLAKPMALTLPFVLLLLDWFYDRKDNKSCLFEKIPFFLYIIPLAYITHVHNYSTVSVNPNLFQAVLIFIWSFTFYIFKFIFPFALVPLYKTPQPVSILNPVYQLSLIMSISMVFLTFKYRRNKIFIFSFMFYVVSIFCLLRFDVMDNLTVVADRYMYLPSLGFCLLAGVIIDKFLLKQKIKKMTSCVVSILFLLLASKSVEQTQIWKDSISVWSQVIRYEPSVYIAYNSRGAAYQKMGDVDLALKDYKKAIEINPEFYLPYGHIGLIYMMENQDELAKSYLNKALEINPSDANSYNSLGLIYERQGQPELAISQFSLSISKDPHYYNGFYNRGMLYAHLDRTDLALKDLSEALRLFPYKAETFNDRGNLYMKLGEWDLAMADYQNALRLSPEYVHPYNNIGTIFGEQGKNEEAIRFFTKAISVNPSMPQSYRNRSIILNKEGRKEEALVDALKAKELGADGLETYIEALKTEMKS